MFTSKEEYHARYSKCKSCDRFDDVFKRCKECSCFMPIKCKISSMKCPKDYWGIAPIVSQVDTLETVENL